MKHHKDTLTHRITIISYTNQIFHNNPSLHKECRVSDKEHN